MTVQSGDISPILNLKLSPDEFETKNYKVSQDDYEVEKVNVSKGDRVKAGDIIWLEAYINGTYIRVSNIIEVP